MEIRINQLGYLPQMDKPIAVVDAQSGLLEVLNADGRTVYSQEVQAAPVTSWGDQVTWLDISPVTGPGVYTVRLNDTESQPFRVADDVYQTLLTALVDMFWYQRCGGELDERAGVFKHPACHTAPARIYDTEERIDVTGGWHDAGDYGRYVVPGAKSVADLMLAWEANPLPFAETNITELRRELRWELDWMLKMQRGDGGVYHKVTYPTFTALNNMPEEDTREQVICPVSSTATGDLAASFAMAYRFYRKEDPDYAATLLNAALKAQQFLDANSPMLFLRNPEGIRTGGYCDGSDSDERLWALVELARSLGGKWLTRAEDALREADLTNLPLGWADVRGYAVLTGCELNGPAGELCRKALLSTAEHVMDRVMADEGWRTALTERVVWGSNMIVANDGMTLLWAMKYGGDKAKLRAAAGHQLHYLLGLNPMDQCYVSGFGSRPLQHPHHRPSVSRGQAVPGLLSGGPCAGLADARARELLQGQPAGKCFVDDHLSYSTNEICIYWNSPMVALLAALLHV